MAAAIVYYRCIRIKIVDTKFQNSYGHSIIAMNMEGNSLIFNTTFYYTLSLYSPRKSILFAGILFGTSYNIIKATLIIDHCTFYNILSVDGKSNKLPIQSSTYNIGIVTLIHSNKSSYVYDNAKQKQLGAVKKGRCQVK